MHLRTEKPGPETFGAPDGHDHDFLSGDQVIVHNERKTLLVVVLTTVTMVAEIIAGRLTGSMALLADGWHMASHAGALLIAVLAYRLAKSQAMHRNFTFGAGKFIPLGGYTSAIALGLVAVLVASESIGRLLDPKPISFDEAIVVAVLGLLVNVASALILGIKHPQPIIEAVSEAEPHNDDHDHDHDHSPSHAMPGHHHDHNIRSAYLHVLADAVTSVAAIAALSLGRFFGVTWMDPLMGFAGAMIILTWAYGLCRDTAWELLDGHAKAVDSKAIQAIVENNAETRVADLHCWRVAPQGYACELVVESPSAKGPDFYRNQILAKLPLHHVIVEERVKKGQK